MKRELLFLIGTGTLGLGAFITHPTRSTEYYQQWKNGIPWQRKHTDMGPDTTDQPQRGEYGRSGRQVEAKPGADDQNKFRWPWDDDDTPGGNVTGDGAYGPGGVDSDFDAMPYLGVLAVVAVLIFLSSARRSV